MLRYLYLGEVPKDLAPQGGDVSEEEVVLSLVKVSKMLEVEQLWEAILAGSDRRLARQRYQAEVERARDQVEDFFRQHVVGHKMVVATDRVQEVKWKHDNAIFADVLLRADEPLITDAENGIKTPSNDDTPTIPIGPAITPSKPTPIRKSVLYPAHKAMLIRSEYFEKMFSGDFVESAHGETLRIVTVDCTPAVLEIILTFLYTETMVCPLEHALDLLYAADMLFLDNLKNKAAVAISTLGSGTTHNNILVGEEVVEMEPINIYDVIHAAWDLRVQRLEEFAARYLANRLEDYIDEQDFQDLIEESAQRLKTREETDTIELLDDIRYYLSERFRLRFEDAGLDEIMDEEGEISAELAAAMADQAQISEGPETAHIPAPATNGNSHHIEKPSEEGEDNEPTVLTLNGEAAEDEFASDAINYQILLGKIDAMLDRLKLDA